MDYYRDYERKVNEKLSIRDQQEMQRIIGKSELDKFPYKNSCNKGTGEYSPSIDDKIKVIK